MEASIVRAAMVLDELQRIQSVFCNDDDQAYGEIRLSFTPEENIICGGYPRPISFADMLRQVDNDITFDALQNKKAMQEANRVYCFYDNQMSAMNNRQSLVCELHNVRKICQKVLRLMEEHPLRHPAFKRAFMRDTKLCCSIYHARNALRCAIQRKLPPKKLFASNLGWTTRAMD